MAATVVKSGKSVLFGTMPGGDKSALVREKELAPISMGFLKFQTDKAAKNIEVSSNSNSDKDNYIIQSDLVTSSSDTNLKFMDNSYIYHEFENCDKAKNHVVEIFESSSTMKPSQHSFLGSETKARNFEIPFEKLLDIYEDIEMESLSNVTIENLELKIASLHSWKRVIRNKANSNSKDSSTSMQVPAKRLTGASDPNTDLDINHK
nr:hypothetical protein CFP56_59781 [Quercus suber]